MKTAATITTNENPLNPKINQRFDNPVRIFFVFDAEVTGDGFSSNVAEEVNGDEGTRFGFDCLVGFDITGFVFSFSAANFSKAEANSIAS
jgi:hypothetical protein